MLLPALWPRGRNTYFAVLLRAGALLEAEILQQLWELVCAAGLHIIFPDQHKRSEKSLPNGFGGNLVFTSDLILLNILRLKFCLFILYMEMNEK